MKYYKALYNVAYYYILSSFFYMQSLKALDIEDYNI